MPFAVSFSLGPIVDDLPLGPVKARLTRVLDMTTQKQGPVEIRVPLAPGAERVSNSRPRICSECSFVLEPKYPFDTP